MLGKGRTEHFSVLRSSVRSNATHSIGELKNWSFQKMTITKNLLLNWYSSMKKNQKDSDDFWHRKLTLKVKFWHFLTNLVISFYYSWYLAKNLFDFYPSLQNSTTGIAIMYNHQHKRVSLYIDSVSSEN